MSYDEKVRAVKTARAMRAVQIGGLILDVLMLALDLSVGRFVLALMPVACILALSVAIHVQTKTIRRREYLARPRPDYAAIARMEREVYGETFEHEGAARAFPIAAMADFDAWAGRVAGAAARRQRREPPAADDLGYAGCGIPWHYRNITSGERTCPACSKRRANLRRERR